MLAEDEYVVVGQLAMQPLIEILKSFVPRDEELTITILDTIKILLEEKATPYSPSDGATDMGGATMNSTGKSADIVRSQEAAKANALILLAVGILNFNRYF